MKEPINLVMDAIDVETFLACTSEEEARNTMLEIMKRMGLNEAEIVFVETIGPGARVRARCYVHKPGDEYRWLRGGRKHG
ncbi:MAG TPA: hypothetical protein GXX40_00830 [Firmicutes bacterium]|nr:hypothetical protein [Bacillota bacterium]